MRLTLGVLFASLLIAASAASAADSGTKAREKEAKKACAAGDFRKGVEILAELYVDTNDVTFVFNQGRCYEQNHQLTSAIDRFREYLRKSPDAGAAERADAEKHIADCEALREQENAKQAPPPSIPAPTPAPAPVAAPPVATPDNGVAGKTGSAKGHSGLGLRVAGIVLGSAGVATAVTGVFLNIKANSLADDYNRTQNPSTQSSQSSYKTGAIVCYGAGAAMLAAGVVLYLVGQSDGGNEAQVSWLPALGPDGFSLSARRTF